MGDELDGHSDVPCGGCASVCPHRLGREECESEFAHDGFTSEEDRLGVPAMGIDDRHVAQARRGRCVPGLEWTVSDRDLLAQRFRSGNVLRAQTASRSLAIAPSDIKTSFETKIDISKKLALEIIISYTLAEWESVKEISFGKPFTSSSSLLAEAPTTGARGDCVEELETWAAAARRGKKFVEVDQARAKARHKPERLPQVGAPLGPFREFLVRTLHLQFFSTTELLFHKVPFQETTADPKEDLMTAKALQHIVSLGFVDLVVRIKGFQICSGGDHLKISIEAWLRSILLPSFGLCLYAPGEGDDVDLSVRGLLRCRGCVSASVRLDQEGRRRLS